MDSLLDALTNVVGILLLVLILTSLNMSRAVERIMSELQPVSEEELVESKRLRDQKRDDLATLKADLAQRKDVVELENQKKELAIELDGMKVDDEIDKLRSDIEALRKLIEEAEKLKVEQIDEVTKKDNELAALKAMLDDTPILELPPPQLVTLPDPRPAPDRAEPRYVICKGGKLYFVGDCYQHLFAARDYIDSKFINLVYQGPAIGTYYHTFQGTKKNESGGWDALRDRDDNPFVKFRYDGAKVVKLFESEASQLGGPHLGYKVIQSGQNLQLRIVPRESGGWAADAFKRTNSEFDLVLKRVQGERHYIYFLVAPDSFQVYTEARQMVEFYKIPAGWTVWAETEFVPDPSVQRDTAEYNFANYIPVTQLRALADKLQPMLEKNAETAQAEVDSIQDAELKAYAQTRYANGIKYNASNIARLADVTESVRGVKEVQISPQAPNIPLVYAFTPSSVPTQIPKPPPPGKKADPPPGKGKDILD